MSRVKRHLSGAERVKYLADLRWLKATGAEVEIPDSLPSEVMGLETRQWGPNFENIVFKLHPGRTAVIVGVYLLPLRSGVQIVDCQISLPRTDRLFLEIARDDGCYRLPGIEYQNEMMLNQHIMEPVFLDHGKAIEGLLIFSSFDPFPEHFRHAMPVNADLTFTDQFGRKSHLEAQLRVDLRMGHIREVPRQQDYTGLFDGAELNLTDQDSVPNKSDETVLQVDRQSDCRDENVFEA